MDNITRRVLAGEIVLTKNTDGFAAVALAEKLESTSVLYGHTVLRMSVSATKSDGSTVSVKPTGVIGRTVIDGHDVVKVAVTVQAPARAARVSQPVNGFCRCGGEADNHGRCYQCGGYQRHADAGRYL